MCTNTFGHSMNFEIPKIIFLSKKQQSNFLTLGTPQASRRVVKNQILEQMVKFSKRVDDHLMESKEFPTKY